jgi:hypothetical protein
MDEPINVFRLSICPTVVFCSILGYFPYGPYVILFLIASIKNKHCLNALIKDGHLLHYINKHIKSKNCIPKTNIFLFIFGSNVQNYFC